VYDPLAGLTLGGGTQSREYDPFGDVMFSAEGTAATVEEQVCVLWPSAPTRNSLF
jgi:hypothetical protein